MAEESFLLVNLKEDKAKELAQVISNDSCRKILEFLTKNKEVTESEIAKAMDLPLSTVHYNLQHLYKAGLVEADEFHYSKKGKEVNHYRLANKFIIIAPTEKSGILEKLKKILPLGIFAAIGAGLIHLYQIGGKNLMASDMALKSGAVVEEAQIALSASAPAYSAPVHEPNVALWFLAGTIFMILIVLVINLKKK